MALFVFVAANTFGWQAPVAGPAQMPTHGGDGFFSALREAVVARVPNIEGILSSRPKPELVVFSLLRGGNTRGAYTAYVDSRECLAAALHFTKYDDVAFHEGNIAAEMRRWLLEKM
jgi:hypothetical protein